MNNIEWHTVANGNLWADAGQSERLHVVRRDEQWFWYSITYVGARVNHGGLFGPFTSATAAKNDCETVHKEVSR